MASPLESESGRTLLRALRIIVVALTTGPVLFLVVVTFLRLNAEEPDTFGPGGHLISYLSFAVAVMALMMRAVMPGLVAAQARKQIARGTFKPGGGASGKAWAEVLSEGGVQGRLLAVYQSTTIVGAAIVEGAALFACVAFFLEGWWLAAGVSVLFTVLVPVMHFPTRQGAQEWIERQEKLLREEGQLP